MKFLLATTLTCVVLVVETTEMGKGLSQMPVLSLDGLLNNIMRIDRTVAVLKSDMHLIQDSINSSDVLPLERDIALLKKQNERLQTNLKERTEKLQSDLRKVSEKLRERRVVFEAQLPSHTTFGKKRSPEVPSGNASKPHSGMFLVPADGTYLIWANVMHYGTGRFGLYLMRGQEILTRGYTGYTLTHGTATINHVVQLKRGDHVWFSVDEESKIYGNNYSSFGGVLLFV